ncbi:MAG: YcaO-like family protein [Candidatus Pacebacteria bacterium]|nr:YcaO-like family protein [Candidatus Paceibacterota bacterium]
MAIKKIINFLFNNYNNKSIFKDSKLSALMYDLYHIKIFAGEEKNSFFGIVKFGISADSINVYSSSVKINIIKNDNYKMKGLGEFLERFSAKLPLDQTLSQSKVFSWSLLGLKFKFSNKEELYYGIKSPNSVRGHQKTTNGYAGHFFLKNAILNAWLELVERDSFMVYWLNSIAPKQISLKDPVFESNQRLKEIKSYLSHYKLNLIILDITSDLAIPSIACVLYSHEVGNTYFGVGACSGFNFEDIFLSALSESLSVAAFTHNKESSLLINTADPSANKDYIDKNVRLLIYLNKENFSKISFFVSNRGTTSIENLTSNLPRLDTLPQKMNYLKNIFRKRLKSNKDYNVYFYRIKNKLLKKLGYFVVKVTCSALYPFYLRERYINLEHSRLKEFTRNMGLTDEAKDNFCPHPFP